MSEQLNGGHATYSSDRNSNPSSAESSTGPVETGSVDLSMLEAIRTREELFRELTEALPVGVLHFDACESVVFTNPRLLEIVGLTRLETVSQLRELVSLARLDEFEVAVRAVLHHGEPHDLELQLDLREIDRVRVCQMNLRPLRNSTGSVNGVIACLFDVTESVRLRDELQERVNVDDLTGCDNRASTLRHLARFLANGDVGVLFIDLDEFKPVNDTYGHNVGDEFLSMAASRLRANVRREDIVGRIGGDEFVVLYPGLADSDQLSELLVRLRVAFQGPVEVGGVKLQMKASFGSAFGETGSRPEEVLARADAAMYSVKRIRDPRSRLSVRPLS